jgi:DNA-binding NarL/FixJ family response regulator
MADRIVLIEDDEFFRTKIEQHVRDRWPNKFELMALRTEKEFLKRFDDLTTHPPKLIIIDQMVPFTTAEDKDWDEAPQHNAFRGGTRCYERLEEDSRTRHIPVVFFTILDPETVPTNVIYVKKSGDSEMAGLLDAISRVLDDR